MFGICWLLLTIQWKQFLIHGFPAIHCTVQYRTSLPHIFIPSPLSLTPTLSITINNSTHRLDHLVTGHDTHCTFSRRPSFLPLSATKCPPSCTEVQVTDGQSIHIGSKEICYSDTYTLGTPISTSRGRSRV